MGRPSQEEGTVFGSSKILKLKGIKTLLEACIKAPLGLEGVLLLIKDRGHRTILSLVLGKAALTMADILQSHTLKIRHRQDSSQRYYGNFNVRSQESIDLIIQSFSQDQDGIKHLKALLLTSKRKY